MGAKRVWIGLLAGVLIGIGGGDTDRERAAWSQTPAPPLERVPIPAGEPRQQTPVPPLPPPPASPPPETEAAGSGWLSRLDLSPEQMQQLRMIQQNNQADLRQRTRELQQGRQRLRQLLIGDAAAEQVREQYQQVQRLSQQINNRRFESILEIRQVLTLEQRREMADLLEDRPMGLREGRRGRPRFRQ